MSYTAKQTVGNVTYYQIDSIIPLFSGSVGDIAISKYGSNPLLNERYIYMAQSNGSWGKMINPEQGQANGISQVPTANLSATEGSIYLAPYWDLVDEHNMNYNISVGFLFNSQSLGRYLLEHNLTFENTTPNGFVDCWVALALNNTVFTPYAYTSLLDNTNNKSIAIQRIYDTGGLRGDKIRTTQGFIDELTTTCNYRITNGQFSVKQVDEPIIHAFEDWETGDFNGWETAQAAQTNYWIVGTATSNSGSYSAFITDDGVNNQYEITSAAVSHLYKTFNFPSTKQFGNLTLDFDWKSQGESKFDYLRVYFAPESVTPVAGTLLGPPYQKAELLLNGSWTHETIDLGEYSQYTASGWKLIYSWRNDTLFGTQPPAAIDNIALSTYLRTYQLEQLNTGYYVTSSFSTGNFGTDGWTVVNDTTNKWVVSTNDSYTGSYCAHITNASGSTNAITYTMTTAQVSHFYQDVTLPSSGDITLKFYWKCWGENSGTTSWFYDYGTVNIIGTGTTPVAGTEVSKVLATAGGTGRIGNDAFNGKFNESIWNTTSQPWTLETIDLSAWAGQTIRLVFSWKNDSSVGNDPPFELGYIELSSGTEIKVEV